MCLRIKVDKPDHVLAEGVANGIEWVVTRNGMGYRCGYARIPSGHPWHGRDHNDIHVENIHGGLTFAEADKPCHKKGEADDAWWIGFDCAHSGDKQDPSLPAVYHAKEQRDYYSSIKTTAYVQGNCERLCQQIAAAAL